MSGKASTQIIPVILSGGSGTRLWPVSTAAAPKQFQQLAGSDSMFRQTLARTKDREAFAAPVIVCGAAHVEHVEADLAAMGMDDARIIVEPAGRNTAPAIALAALDADPSALLLVMPADHVMTNAGAFLEAVSDARAAVERGALATFGITPSHPETGYGYIAAGDLLPGDQRVYAVRRFVEKPALAAASAMLAEGGHFWNAGIFLMRADRFLAELEDQRPAIIEACRGAMEAAREEGTRLYPGEAAFCACKGDSIDYAVMEGSDNVVVVPVDPGWSDVGGWAALHELGDKDDDANVCIGDVIAIDAKGNYLRAGTGKRVAVVGVEDIIVVAHGDDLLVIPRGRAQEVKAIAELLAARDKAPPES